ncbi:MAG: 50S ribosomal protein L6 [Deltaproteobacteria bacterium]|jgi:large subunit ribosomal protein L6|nr:50S ribosomal protein L6 [Deltaproteobacteria bacterium]MBW2529930.1 50S ribosomal protein L6 [Deltaproteobacteria bacterium]
MATQAEQATSTTSRIGKRPIPVPKGVAVTISGSDVQIKGPKGALSRALPDQVAVAQEGDELQVTTTAPGRSGARLQGLTRALVANMVRGVSEGYEKVLELHGTGYRAELQGNDLHFALGFSHPIVFSLPEGVTATIPKDSKGSLLILQGTDKAVVGQTAATIRGFRPPEPYGGKGVRYRGERVREKAGKAGK